MGISKWIEQNVLRFFGKAVGDDNVYIEELSKTVGLHGSQAIYNSLKVCLLEAFFVFELL